MPNLLLNYSKRDVSDVLLSLYQQIGNFTDNQWTDFLNSDVGTALLQTMTAIQDFNAFFTDAQAAETFLSTCQDRESGIRIAKMLNYVPQTAQAASCEVLLTFPAFNHEIDLPANTIWSINNISFTCLDPIIIPSGQTSLHISLTQGTPYTSTLTAPGTPWYSVTIPPNACQIIVKVNDVVWTETDSWLTATSTTTYKRYESTAGQVIEFGNGDGTSQLPLAPSSGDTVEITAVLTNGASGNVPLSQQNVNPQSALRDSFDDTLINNAVSATSLTAALGGADPESLLSIQTNAPAFYGTQGRVVTTSDYVAVVKTVPGVVDQKVVGGEDLANKGGFYSYVYITIRGDDPFTVSGTLMDNVKAKLTSLNVVPIDPVVQAPEVFSLSMILDLGLIQNSYQDASVARNLVNTVVNNFFAAPSQGGVMGIGESLYRSQLSSAIQAISGIKFSDMKFSLTSTATSSAGVARIPVPTNVDVTNCTLKDASNNVLFSGDGTQYVGNGLFIFSHNGLSDQACTLTFSVVPPDGTQTYDVLIAYNQLVVLNSLVINAEFVS